MLPWRRQAAGKPKAPNSVPIQLALSYARDEADLALFGTSPSAGPFFLGLQEVLVAFPGGICPADICTFNHKGHTWQLACRTRPQDGSSVYLAIEAADSSYSATSPLAAAAAAWDQETPAPGLSSAASASPTALAGRRLTQSMSTPQRSPLNFRRSFSASSEPADMYSQQQQEALGYPTPPGKHTPHAYQQQQQQQRLGFAPFSAQDELAEYRQFFQRLNLAKSGSAPSERYNALMWLIAHCRARLMGLPLNTPWSQEPAAGVLCDILDVGEALVQFGNCHFPERSNEGRAVLAADFKRLMQEYLGKLGSVFVPGAVDDKLPGNLHTKLLSVSSQLDTRCSTYNLLFDQLVSSVGREGGKGSASAIVINAPSTSITANPHNNVTANPVNTASASAQSKSKAVNRGMGAAAVAAAGLLGFLLLKGMRGGGGRRGGGKGGKGGRGGGKEEGGSGGRRLRLPRDKAGREMVLVGQLSSCADEMRKASVNEGLLKDDWRLGRVRLAWPPAPEPPGYQSVAYDACNVTQLLQDMYGR